MKSKPGSPGAANSTPVIPPPPKFSRRGKRGRSDRRYLWWAIALALGIGAGAAAYGYVPRVPFYFDFWVAMALS